MDYRKFLGKTESLVLPYFGGTRLDSSDRRLRLDATGELEPGWWRFDVSGRKAVPIERAEPPPLDALPAVRGHFAGGWIFCSGSELERIALPPDDEPEVLARCIGRRWYGGEVLFDQLEFDDDAEAGARAALDEARGLTELRGVTPSLRAAFGFSVLAAAARARDLRVSPREAQARVMELAAGGRPVADAMLDRVVEERRQSELRRVARQAERVRRAERQRDPVAWAESALEAAQARLLRSRRIGADQLEVVFSFMGETFISVVSTRTLQVHDAGICLSGADRELTLESLPSAIREAIDTGVLYITRHDVRR